MDAQAITTVAPRQVLADHAYDVLVELLVDGRLEAGSAINIDSLARSMEISRTPIREALARLEATNLVRRTALKGYRVAPLPSTEELLELMDARLVIEPVNAFLACDRNNSSLVAQLQQSLTVMTTSPRGAVFSEFRDYLQADEQFHLSSRRAREIVTCFRRTRRSADRLSGFACSRDGESPTQSRRSRSTTASSGPSPTAIPRPLVWL
jgi:DNA-binding GntR family transcriptional regulator